MGNIPSTRIVNYEESTPTPRFENPETSEKSIVVQRESIIVEGGVLVFDRGDHPRVPILKGWSGSKIHVGCHTITREAWELLKKLVDGE